MKTQDFIKTQTIKEDVEESQMIHNNLHTIIRAATELDGLLGSNASMEEWAKEKIAITKSMIVTVMDYVISQHEMAQDQDIPVFDENDAEATLAEELGDEEGDDKLTFTTGGSIGGTSLQGYVTASYDQLVKVFGEPDFGPNAADGDKVTCEWDIMFSDGTPATIYDWKEEETPMHETEWHVGGKSKQAILNVNQVLGTDNNVSEEDEGIFDVVDRQPVKEISAKLAGDYYGKATQKHLDKVGLRPNMYDRIEKDMGKQRKQGVDRAMDRIFKHAEKSKTTVKEDATTGASGASTVAVTVQTLGEKGSFTRRDLNKKFAGYTNRVTNNKKVNVKGGY
jgi:hypothetical protein